MLEQEKVQVSFQGKTWLVPRGQNLRKAIMEAGLSPHNKAARKLNCRGLGTCGTCAVELEGEVNQISPREAWRLNFPPHRLGRGLRLACQCRAYGNLHIVKYPGFWGEKKPGI